MDNTGSGEVNNTNVTPRVITESGQETASGPDGSDNNGVDESSKEDRVAQVSLHLAAFGDGTGNNGGGSGSESELEEPSDEVTSRGEVTDEEVLGTNKVGVSRGVVVVGESVTDGVETEGTSASIQQVLQHDILDVLLTNGSSTKHGESGLHQENKSSGEEKEEDVHTILQTRDVLRKSTLASLDDSAHLDILQYYDDKLTLLIIQIAAVSDPSGMESPKPPHKASM